MKCNAGLGKSDHLLLVFDLNCYNEVKTEEEFQKFNFFKGKYMPINAVRQEIDRDSQLQGLDITTLWSHFAEILLKLLENIYQWAK